MFTHTFHHDYIMNTTVWCQKKTFPTWFKTLYCFNRYINKEIFKFLTPISLFQWPTLYIPTHSGLSPEIPCTVHQNIRPSSALCQVKQVRFHFIYYLSFYIGKEAISYPQLYCHSHIVALVSRRLLCIFLQNKNDFQGQSVQAVQNTSFS